jgi:hypothetical protein
VVLASSAPKKLRNAYNPSAALIASKIATSSETDCPNHGPGRTHRNPPPLHDRSALLIDSRDLRLDRGRSAVPLAERRATWAGPGSATSDRGRCGHDHPLGGFGGTRSLSTLHASRRPADRLTTTAHHLLITMIQHRSKLCLPIKRLAAVLVAAIAVTPLVVTATAHAHTLSMAYSRATAASLGRQMYWAVGPAEAYDSGSCRRRSAHDILCRVRISGHAHDNVGQRYAFVCGQFVAVQLRSARPRASLAYGRPACTGRYSDPYAVAPTGSNPNPCAGDCINLVHRPTTTAGALHVLPINATGGQNLARALAYGLTLNQVPAW